MTKATSAKYIEAVGRRKTSVARVRLVESKAASVTVNDRPIAEYFPVKSDQLKINEPFTTSETTVTYAITAKVNGGGIHSQAEAVRLGVSRALLLINGEYRKPLKKAGLLKRDSRAKERRKFGLKKARKAPQWSKR